MSRGPGPGFCQKALWYGWGGDAGCCTKPAYGPTPVNMNEGVPRDLWKHPLTWACPEHGGPPRTPETEFLRNAAMKRHAEEMKRRWAP